MRQIKYTIKVTEYGNVNDIIVRAFVYLITKTLHYKFAKGLLLNQGVVNVKRRNSCNFIMRSMIRSRGSNYFKVIVLNHIKEYVQVRIVVMPKNPDLRHKQRTTFVCYTSIPYADSKMTIKTWRGSTQRMQIHPGMTGCCSINTARKHLSNGSSASFISRTIYKMLILMLHRY